MITTAAALGLTTAESADMPMHHYQPESERAAVADTILLAVAGSAVMKLLA